jgi:hypothetical protein
MRRDRATRRVMRWAFIGIVTLAAVFWVAVAGVLTGRFG